MCVCQHNGCFRQSMHGAGRPRSVMVWKGYTRAKTSRVMPVKNGAEESLPTLVSIGRFTPAIASTRHPIVTWVRFQNYLARFSIWTFPPKIPLFHRGTEIQKWSVLTAPSMPARKTIPSCPVTTRLGIGIIDKPRSDPLSELTLSFSGHKQEMGETRNAEPQMDTNQGSGQ